jgi:hypothetical protein
MLSDGDVIRNLLGSYCERIDDADYDGVGALFGVHGVLATDDGTELARGAEAIAAFYRGLVRLHDGRQRTKHVTTNTVLEPDGPDTIRARSSFVVFQATDELPLQPIMAGRYDDRFERDSPTAWRWAERRYTSDLVGHLGQHIGRI